MVDMKVKILQRRNERKKGINRLIWYKKDRHGTKNDSTVYIVRTRTYVRIHVRVCVHTNLFAIK